MPACVGAARPSSRLTEAQVLDIRQRHASGERLVDIARRYPQCSTPNLHHIVHGRRWRYLLERGA